MQDIIKLQSATLAARTRTGDKTISTSANKGLVRVERVTYNPRGIATISPLSADLPMAKAVEFLNAI